MCQGAAMARKTSVEGMRWNFGSRRSWRVSSEVEEDEAEGEDEADEALGEEVEGGDGGEGEAGEEGGVSRATFAAACRGWGIGLVSVWMRSRAMRKAWTARVIQRQIRMSGMKKRV